MMVRRQKSMELPRTFYTPGWKGQSNSFLSLVQRQEGPRVGLEGELLGKIREKQEDCNENSRKSYQKGSGVGVGVGGGK